MPYFRDKAKTSLRGRDERGTLDTKASECWRCTVGVQQMLPANLRLKDIWNKFCQTVELRSKKVQVHDPNLTPMPFVGSGNVEKILRAPRISKSVLAIGFSLSTAFLFNDSAYAGVLATQDFFFIDSIGVTSGGSSSQLIDEAIAQALGSSFGAVTFPGGGIFTQTTAFGEALAGDANNIILGNTSVVPGVFSFAGKQVLSVLVSSDVDAVGLTLGTSGVLQLNFATIFPADVVVGDGGAMNYSMIQLLKPNDTTSEISLSPLEVAVSRASSGLVVYPSIDNTNLLYGEDIPFTVAEGSKGMRYFGKFLQVCGATLTGGLTGACAGATVGAGVGAVVGGVPTGGAGAVPGAATGAVAGGIVGGVAGAAGAGLSKAGDVIVENNKDNVSDTPNTRPLPPSDGRPSDQRLSVIVPGPLPLLGVGAAFGFSRKLRKRIKSSKTPEVLSAIG